MLGELFKDVADSISDLRYGTATRTITVAKPYCSPARDIITGTLKKYGVKIYNYSEAARMINPLTVLKQSTRVPDAQGLRIPNALPGAQVAKITVAEGAAAWAEYLLLRTGKLYVPGAYVNKRNEQWAAQHGGQMPPAWKDGKPWIEHNCKAGMDAWQPIREAATKGEK